MLFLLASPGMSLFAIIFIVLCIALYFLPTYIASKRKKKNIAAIAIINILLGWTILGWVGALVWAIVQEQSDGENLRSKQEYESQYK